MCEEDSVCTLLVMWFFSPCFVDPAITLVGAVDSTFVLYFTSIGLGVSSSLKFEWSCVKVTLLLGAAAVSGLTPVHPDHFMRQLGLLTWGHCTNMSRTLYTFGPCSGTRKGPLQMAES